jgi:hypothetical protein
MFGLGPYPRVFSQKPPSGPQTATPPTNPGGVNNRTSAAAQTAFTSPRALAASTPLVRVTATPSATTLRPVKETVQVNGKQYQIETQLPAGTTDLEKDLFVAAFRDNILSKIMRENTSLNGQFDVCFEKDNEFSIVQGNGETKTFPLEIKSSDEHTQLKERLLQNSCNDIRKILQASSTAQPTVTVTPLLWDALIPSVPHIKIIETKENDTWVNAFLQLLLDSGILEEELMKRHANLDENLRPLYQFYLDYCSPEGKPNAESIKTLLDKLSETPDFTTSTAEIDPGKALKLILSKFQDFSSIISTNESEKKLDRALFSRKERSNDKKHLVVIAEGKLEKVVPRVTINGEEFILTTQINCEQGQYKTYFHYEDGNMSPVCSDGNETIDEEDIADIRNQGSIFFYRRAEIEVDVQPESLPSSRTNS